MPISLPDWLDEYPSPLRETLDAALSGTLDPPILFTRLFLALQDVGAIASLLSRLAAELRAAGDEEGAYRIEAVRAFTSRDPAILDVMHRVLAILHGGSQSQQAQNASSIAAAFDAAVEMSAESSVALYSLGDAAFLKTATQELVCFLRDRSLISRNTRALEIGCGIGRFAQALAGDIASFTGIDISPKMIRVAQDRCAGLPNVTFSVTSGRDLRDHADASFEFVLAVDSFPYINAACRSLADLHIRESARILAGEGSLAIFNFCYDEDFNSSRVRLTRLADEAGLSLAAAEPRPLHSWDGSFFHLRKQGRPA